MKNKYDIGESLEDKETDYFGVIEDIEEVDCVTLYYFEDGKVLPEERVSLKGVKGMRNVINFINLTEDEKNKISEEALEKVGLNDLIKYYNYPKWLRKILSYLLRHRR